MDPFYMGQSHDRLEGDEYFTLLDELMAAIRNRYPNVFIQFEDFSSDRALAVLNRYRYDSLCFNDDIQGTGAVAVAGILSALKAQDISPSKLVEQRFVVAGSGSAGIGVVTALCEAMVVLGLSPERARDQFWICDIDGVLADTPDRSLTAGQKMFARDDETAGMSLSEVVDHVKPNVLVGLSTVGGLFSEDILTSMAENSERPIIFPLSNPTASAECTAEQAYRCSGGRAIFGSGSPFDPVEVDGKLMTPSQCNNMFIFPGLGLGATLCGARYISESVIYQTSLALAESLTDEERAAGQIFPSVNRIREISHVIAMAVIRQAHREGIASRSKLKGLDVENDEDLGTWVSAKSYDPVYVPIHALRG